MKQVLLGLGLMLLGAAILISTWQLAGSNQSLSMLTFAGGMVLTTIGSLIALTAVASRSQTGAVIRLDHFLPFLRKKKKSETLAPESFPVRAARRILPAAFFANQETGKPGLFRKGLKRLGPTVHSAPLRRIVQAICFCLFLLLFFYVLWPYSALPEPPGKVTVRWQMHQVDSASGNLEFVPTAEPQWIPRADENVHLVDERALDALRGDLGEFRVLSVSPDSIVLSPAEPLLDEVLDALLTSTGTWAIHEKSPWPSHYTNELAQKEFVPADIFLIIDPLVSLSTAIASRSWVWSLACAGVILIICVLIPRGFCGYLCPLGTLIDLFDWSITRHVTRFRVSDEGWWVHVKYYLLLGILVCASAGVLVSGVFAAIPIITRGMLFLGEPFQSGVMRGWSQVPGLNAGHFVSILLFLAVLSLGFLKPRFWCKYVCPSGAVFSLGNLFRVSERKVESSCINCNKCVEICPFDAIKPDFTTRTTDCTLCQTCAGVCPTHAIKFVERWNGVELKVLNDPPTHETALGRRGFLSLAAGSAAGIFGGLGVAATTKAFGARLGKENAYLPVRPPGSVPEQEFLEMCIRCGECFKACPYNVLQPIGFQQGLEGLWTPEVVADHAGCASSCNACGQVCPTGAIRALPLEEKKVARMGLAIVNESTCLPFANEGACQLCVDECTAAGYHAIEFRQVHTEVDENGLPIEGTGYVAPVVLNELCVGCGLCQMSCYRVNVKQERLLKESAIIVEAGAGKEDRLMSGSYRQLRAEELRTRPETQPAVAPYEQDSPLAPDDSSNPFGLPEEDDNPFGLPEKSGSPIP